MDVIDGWTALPAVVIPEADVRHARRLRELLHGVGGRAGNLVNDAHLAALAMHHGAIVMTFDADFGRFSGVRWQVPAGE
ncbi:MAG: PIN domain-containing protein [Propioniciclava sp.]